VQVNRLRRKIERDPANPLIVQTVRGVGYRLVAALSATMTSFDDGIGRLRNAGRPCALPPAGAAVRPPHSIGPITGPWDRFGRWLKSVMPKGLYARSLLIIIVPMVVLQSVVAFMFVERQWSLVTYYLSSAVTQDIATLIDVYKTYPQDADHAQLRRIAQDRLGLVVDFLPETQLPPPGPKPFFSQLDAGAVGRNPQADRPAVLDRHGRPLLDRGNPHQARRHDHARVRAARRRLRSNSWIFLVWMVVTSLVVLTIAILSCATRSGRSCGWPTPPKRSARAARRRISARAARAKSAARRPRSWK
jgi:hypothetical protein